MGIIPTGTPMVLINAFPVDRAQWDRMLSALTEFDAPIGDIITFDVPGVGEMPIPDDEPSLEIIADAATLAMREVTEHDAALWVGCSMGGYIAMAVAERDPDAVAGLVLIGTKASADTDEARARRLSIAESLEGKDGVEDPVAMAEPLIGTQGEDRDALVAEIAANIAKHRGDGIAWGQRAMAARPDRLAVLAELDVPAAVVRGANDGVASEDEAVKMADALGVPVETISGVGHLAAHEAPGAVAAIVARVASQIEAGGR